MELAQRLFPLFLAFVTVGQARGATFTWNASSTGAWNNPSNWLPSTGFPNSVDDVALIGPGMSAPTIVLLPSNVTVEQLVLSNPVFVELAGPGGITLDGGIEAPLFSSPQGIHQVFAPLTLGGKTSFSVGGGSRVNLLGALAMQGNVLIKQGAGELRINGAAVGSSGTLIASLGVVSGSGDLGGSLQNNAATIAPGQGNAGTLDVLGGFSQGDAGTLRIEIGGTSTGQYDRLNVSGAATLAGTLTASLINGYTPSVGDSFTVMTYASAKGEFALEQLPPASVTGIAFEPIMGPTDLRIVVGQGRVWDAGGGSPNWNDATNWQANTIPGGQTLAEIDGNASASITGITVAPVLGLSLGAGQAGSLNVMGGGALTVNGNLRVRNQGSLTIDGFSSRLNAVNAFNSGNVTLNPRATLSATHRYLQTGGTTSLDRASLNANEMFLEGGLLIGSGSVGGSLNVGTRPFAGVATLSPGVTLGTLHVRGNLELGSRSHLHIEIGSAIHDELVVDGAAVLGGTLELSLVDGFVPAPGSLFKILTSDSLATNKFFAEVSPSTNAGGGLIAVAMDDGVYALQVMYGDMNLDEHVDLADLAYFALAMRDEFGYDEQYYLNPAFEGSAAPAFIADVNGNGNLNFDDIAAFVDMVNSSGASLSLAQALAVVNSFAVPEPKGSVLAAMGLALAVVAFSSGQRTRRRSGRQRETTSDGR